MLDLSNDVYIYAQSLDNSGDVEYWRARERLSPGDPALDAVRRVIDATIEQGAKIRSIPGELECWATTGGPCIIQLYPKTLDVDGRVSPVILLFNIYGKNRSGVGLLIKSVPQVTGRQLRETTFLAIEGVLRVVRWPAFLTKLYVLFKKFGVLHD